MPKMAQQTGNGTASSMDIQASGGEASLLAGTITGALWTGCGTVSSGCVLAILAAAGGAGSGRIVMRAVSWRGPACGPEPG